jgi:ABC-type glycerol-3-phosphate transport system substrate-binding protein
MFPVILGLLALAGCSPTAVVLWTNLPDLVPAVELYNASQSDHIVELVFRQDLGSALRLAETPPDLIVGTAIADRSTTRLLQPIDRFMRRELDPTSFYADLLATGARNGRQYLLPVSFNLPVVYFSGALPEIGRSIIISPSELQARSEAFNTAEGAGWVRLAYSPIWNPAFLYEYLRTSGFQAYETENGSPMWSADALAEGVASARAWIETHGGHEADRTFQQKYLYDPQIELVRRGRVAYGYDTSHLFLARSDARREGLGFRWLGTDGAIHVLEEIVYAGIPAGARSRRGAERFLAKLFTEEQQAAIMKSVLRKRVSSFGVAGGFSSLWRVTERHLPAQYPELAGMIPPAAWLRFAPATPRHWDSIVREVVEPWLMREVTGTIQARDLESSVRAWLMQQED